MLWGLLRFYAVALLRICAFTLLRFYVFARLRFCVFTLLRFCAFALLRFCPFTLLRFYPSSFLLFCVFPLFCVFALVLFRHQEPFAVVDSLGVFSDFWAFGYREGGDLRCIQRARCYGAGP